MLHKTLKSPSVPSVSYTYDCCAKQTVSKQKQAKLDKQQSWSCIMNKYYNVMNYFGGIWSIIFILPIFKNYDQDQGKIQTKLAQACGVVQWSWDQGWLRELQPSLPHLHMSCFLGPIKTTWKVWTVIWRRDAMGLHHYSSPQLKTRAVYWKMLWKKKLI